MMTALLLIPMAVLLAGAVWTARNAESRMRYHFRGPTRELPSMLAAAGLVALYALAKVVY